MARTITGGYNVGATITSAVNLIGSDDPLLITTGAEGAMGTIIGANYGIYGNSTQAWTITNFGTVQGTAGSGITLAAGGMVANGSPGNTAAAITGYRGISVSGGTATVTNEGTITGTNSYGVVIGAGRVINGSTANTAALITGDIAVRADDIVTNYATIVGAQLGVDLHGVGTVTNKGSITALNSSGIGIIAYGGGTVINSGTVSAYRGVAMLSAGTVVNAGTAALITGIFLGVYTNHAPVNVTNQGSILGTGSYGIGMALISGGTITNQGPAATIGGARDAIRLASGGVVTNFGTIKGGQHGVVAQGRRAIINNRGLIAGPGVAGVFLGRGGLLINTGTITGLFGVESQGGAMTLTNRGTIIGTGTYGIGIALRSGGTITNQGTITGTGTYGIGIVLSSGGTITNQGTAATIGGALDGIFLSRGGVVTNFGTITGLYGVQSQSGATTLTNRGTIIGTGGTAVDFLGAVNDTVAITRDAVFSGIVKAGVGTDTLALLRGGIGTLTGLGTAFTGFEVLRMDDPAAQWMMAGTNTMASGTLIDVDGRLTVTGTLTVPAPPGFPAELNIAATGTIGVFGTGMIEVGSAGGAVAGKINIDSDGALIGHGILRGAVVNNGLISITGGALTLLNGVTGIGTIEITHNAPLYANGPLFVANLVFSGAGTDEALVASAAVKSTIAGFADHDLIDLTRFLAIPGLSSFVANKLILDNGAGGLFKLSFAPGQTLANFDIAPDGYGGTIIFHI